MAFVINIVLDKQDFLKFQMQKSRLTAYTDCLHFPLISTNDLIKDEKKQIRGKDARKMLEP